MNKDNTNPAHSMNMIKVFFILLKKDGVKSTFSRLLSHIADIFFDLRYGTETNSWAKIEDLEIDSINKEVGGDYIPTQALALSKLFKEIKIPEGKVFIDIGSGKGKTLFVASRFGFRELRGVEFSHELCQTARKNCIAFKKKSGSGAAFNIIESDIVDYEFDNEDVFFMFNPFDDTVLKQVLEKIKASLEKRKRNIWVIYRYPKHSDIIDSDKAFNKEKEYICWGSDFTVYTNSVKA